MPNATRDTSPAEIAYIGSWRIIPIASHESTERVTFALSYQSSNRSGSTALATLGLTTDALGGVPHDVRFEVRREAGTLVCEGTAANGHGAGTFRFAPDPAYARAIADAGLAPLTLREQIKAAVFSVPSSFADVLRASGLHDVAISDFAMLSARGVTADDLRALYAAFPGEGAHGMVSLHMIGVTPDYIEALRRARIRDLSADNVSALRAAGVDQAFIEGLAAPHADGRSIDDVVRLYRQSVAADPRVRRADTPIQSAANAFDHITIDVADLDVSRRFYDQALPPLGIQRLFADGENFFGYGTGETAFFWIGQRGKTPTRAHVAFRAPDRATVDRYFTAAIAAGGREDGAPAIYPEYHPDYYGAFVLDPDGNNIEAVCRVPA